VQPHHMYHRTVILRFHHMQLLNNNVLQWILLCVYMLKSICSLNICKYD